MIRVTIYWIGFVIVLVLLGLFLIFKNEYKRSKKNSKYKQVIGILCKIFRVLFFVSLVAFYGYNIYLLVAMRYDISLIILSLSFIVFIPSLGICVLLFSQEWKYFDIIRSSFSFILGLISVVSSCLYMFCILMIFLSSPYYTNIDEKYTQYGYSIDILKIKEVEYVNVHGGGWYICSTPSNAYYYEVSTNNGNTTTKVLDGYSHYVEKDEDDKYIDNPHIEVIYTMQEYYNMYTMKTYTKVVGENYIICVPENAIYYYEE